MQENNLHIKRAGPKQIKIERDSYRTLLAISLVLFVIGFFAGGGKVNVTGKLLAICQMDDQTCACAVDNFTRSYSGKQTLTGETGNELLNHFYAEDILPCLVSTDFAGRTCMAQAMPNVDGVSVREDDVRKICGCIGYHTAENIKALQKNLPEPFFALGHPNDNMFEILAGTNQKALETCQQTLR